jgi:osmoprotectant transport system permease protein
MGLPNRFALRRIDLPLASLKKHWREGINRSAVIIVEPATLGGLIGAGGYGQTIRPGIRVDDTNLILQGAIPASALALLVQVGFGLAERIFVPRGLRLKPAI